MQYKLCYYFSEFYFQRRFLRLGREVISNETFTGERAMFGAKNLKFELCEFKDGESALKHACDVKLEKSIFGWKYPLWYAQNIDLSACELGLNARAGIWYSKNLNLRNCVIKAPKTFRRSKYLTLTNVTIPSASETLWNCANVCLENVSASGDYFAMDCEKITADGLNLNGNYCFDSARDLTLENCELISKDAFWNSKNVTIKNSFVSGEYIGWNSQNLTMINCEIDSLQGFCYCENLRLINCKLKNTTLAFEYSSVYARIIGGLKSVKNPKSGEIICDRIDDLIMQDDKINSKLTKILTKEK